MNDNKNKYQAEDFWPDAEKLLDEHFNNKRGGNKTILWIVAVLAIVSITGLAYLSINPDESSISISNQLTNGSSPKPSESQNLNNTSIPQPKEPKSSDSINKNALSNSEKLIIEQSIKKESALNNAINKSVLNSYKAKNPTAESGNKELIGNAGAPAKIEEDKNSQQIATNKLFIGNNLATIANQQSFLKENDLNNKASNGEAEYLISESNSTNLITSPEKGSILNKTELESNNSSLQPKEPTENESNYASSLSIEKKESTSENIVVDDKKVKNSVESIPQNDSTIQITSNSILIENDTSKTSSKPLFGVSFNSGIFLTSKKLNATDNSELIERRSKEENTVINSSWGLSMNLQFQKINIKAGIEYNKYGERINYSDYLYKNSQVLQPSWNFFNDSSNTISLSYYNGIEYQRQITNYFNDSTLYYDTAFSNIKSVADLSSYRGINTISYWEIPVSVGYQIFQKSKLSVGVLAGGSIGFLSQKQGYYLSDNMQEIVDLSKTNTIRKTQLNARFGLHAGYVLGKNSTVFIEPQYRIALKSAFDNSAITSQKYRSIGFSVGYLYSF